MNKKTLKPLTWIIPAVLIAVVSCKDKTEDPPPTSTTKTLNKSFLVSKKWYNQGSTIVHDIRANGEYTSGGTWEWKNNTDTMIIDLDGSDPTISPVEWKFFWSTEHEMSCKIAKSSTAELYKDQAW